MPIKTSNIEETSKISRAQSPNESVSNSESDGEEIKGDEVKVEEDEVNDNPKFDDDGYEPGVADLSVQCKLRFLLFSFYAKAYLIGYSKS